MKKNLYMMIIVETERLYFRQITESDAALILQLNSQPEVLQYLHEPMVTSVEHAKEIINSIILPQYSIGLGRWAVFTKQHDEFIGWCGLKNMEGVIELGYRLLPAHCGRGYATEAAGATLLHAHQQLGLEKIVASVHIHNIASQRVLSKIGMRYIGTGEEDGIAIKTYESFRNML